MQGSANFFVKSQRINILDFSGPEITVAITQLCFYGMKAAVDSI